MPPRPGPMRTLLPILVTLAAAACGPRAAPALPPLERVIVEMDGVRVTSTLPDPRLPSWALEGAWAVSDARDAYVVEPGRVVEVALPLAGPLDLTVACALIVPPGGDRDEIAVECELGLSSKAREKVLATRRVSAHDAAHGWIELHEQEMVRPEERARVTVVVRAPNAPSGTRVCITPPRASDTRRLESRPNVLVISVDSLRADRMQSQGYGRPTTPRIDTFLARGTRFQHAVSVAPWTLPAYGTLFTGVMPGRHRAGVSPSREASFLDGRALEPGDFEMLDPALETLAARFAADGYRTAGFVSNPYLDGALGIDRGFQRWTMYLNRATAGVKLAGEWIERQGSAPWFCFLHLMDPHAPYTPPPPFDEQFAGVSVATLLDFPPTLAALREREPDPATKKLLADLYDAEIASADAAIGKLVELLDARGLSPETLVVFHADHGEELWEHGGYEHGHTQHAEVLRVPLGFVFPSRVPEGRFVDAPVSTLDVGATILDLAGQAPFAAGEGRSLVPFLGSTPPLPRALASEALLYGTREEKALELSEVKLITDGGAKNLLYDPRLDPAESRDLASSRGTEIERLRALLVERARSQPRPSVRAPKPALSPARRAEIEKLGYPGPGRPR